jgi:hypothetical protein
MQHVEGGKTFSGLHMVVPEVGNLQSVAWRRTMKTRGLDA